MEEVHVRPLIPATMLALWEYGGRATQPRRAVALLAAASSAPVETLERLPIGQRDALLIEVRRRTFGNQLTGVETCRACGVQLEFSVALDRVLALTASSAWRRDPEALHFEAGGTRRSFRLPTTADVETALTRPGDRESALVESCLDDRSGVSPELIAAFNAACAEADPLADFRLVLACNSCGHEMRVAFDAAAVLWNECAEVAGRLLEDVHRIASAYHWPEDLILALPARRRQFYLSRIAQGGLR